MSDSSSELALRDDEHRRIERSLARLDRLAKLLDDQFELPIVKYRVGLDPIIGLIPGGGDWVTWFVSLYILFEALRLRVPLPILVKIGWNVTIDLVIGYAPGVGDIADAIFKANRRSVRLIFDWFDATKNPRAPDTIQIPSSSLQKPKAGAERWLVGIVLVGLFTALAAAPIVLIWWLLQG